MLFFIDQLGTPGQTPYEVRTAICDAAGYRLIPIFKEGQDTSTASDMACLP